MGWLARRQRGFSLLEGILAIAVAGAASLVIIRFAASSSAQVKQQIAAQQLRAIRGATEDYIRDRHCLDTNDDGVYDVQNIGGSPANLTFANIQSADYLPTWFQTVNPYGETYTIITRRIETDGDTGSLSCTDSVEAVVGLVGRQSGGQCVSMVSGSPVTDGYLENEARAMAAMIGADGGFVPFEDHDRGDPDLNTVTGQPEGAFGGWRFPATLASLYAGAATLPGNGCLVGVIYVRTN